MSKSEYNALHKHHLRVWTKRGKCKHCKQSARTHWANKSGNYIKDDKSDWIELCPKCHAQYDSKHKLRAYKPKKPRPPRLKELKLELQFTEIQFNQRVTAIQRLKSYPWYTE